MSGAVRVNGAGEQLRLATGQGALLPAGTGPVGIAADGGAAVAFRARVGDPA